MTETPRAPACEATKRSAALPIYRLLQNTAFEPQHVAVMTAAFEAACADLGLAERDDSLRDMVARAIIKCAQTGEFDPVRLRECAEKTLRG